MLVMLMALFAVGAVGWRAMSPEQRVNALRTADEWIVLDRDATVPALTDETRTLALAGVPAQWAFPAADTLAGAKFVAHAFLRKVKACRTR